MNIRTWSVAVVAATLGLATGAQAQDGEAVEMLSAGSTAQWRMFSQSETSTYLVDMASILRNGDDATLRIARVSKRNSPGDYSHVVDLFAARCRSGETRVETSADVLEDGETAETYAADEPWTPARSGSFDAAVKEMACGEQEPSRSAFDSIRAWIDAGRP